MTNSKLFNTRNSLSAKTRTQMVDLLNQVLADGMDLYSHTKQAHWNLKGLQFMQLHLLLDTLAAQLLERLDEIAERATALGGVARGTVRMAAAASQLEEYPIDNHSIESHLKTLADHYGKFANYLRYAIKQGDDSDDAGTTDLFTQFVRETDKSLWILESHIEQTETESSEASEKVNGHHNGNGHRGSPKKRMSHH